MAVIRAPARPKTLPSIFLCLKNRLYFLNFLLTKVVILYIFNIYRITGGEGEYFFE